jgi:hypothetical protein
MAMAAATATAAARARDCRVFTWVSSLLINVPDDARPGSTGPRGQAGCPLDRGSSLDAHRGARSCRNAITMSPISKFFIRPPPQSDAHKAKSYGRLTRQSTNACSKTCRAISSRS